MRLIAQWILIALALLALPKIIPGIAITSFVTALIVVFFLGVAHVLIKPILMLILLPINLLTLGLFTFVVNALLFWGIAYFVKGFAVTDFASAFLGALVMSVVSMLVRMILKDSDDD